MSRRDKNRRKDIEFAHMDQVSGEETRVRNLEIANEQLRAENAALKRRLERIEMYEESDKAKAFTLDERIEKLQQQRDRWVDSVNRRYSKASAAADKAHQLSNEYFEATAQTKSLQSRAIHWNVKATLRSADEAFKTSGFWLRSKAQAGKPLDADSDLTVAALVRFGIVIGVNQFAQAMAVSAVELERNPYMICDAIMGHLRSTGNVPIELLSELPKDWIDNNLRIKKPATLKNALEIAQRVEKSSVGEVAAELETASIKNIEHYRKVYNTIRESADNPPEWLSSMLDFEAYST